MPVYDAIGPLQSPPPPPPEDKSSFPPIQPGLVGAPPRSTCTTKTP